MHRDRTADFLAQQLVPRHVVLRQRRLDDGQTLVAVFQAADQRCSLIDAQQQPVKVSIQFEVERRCLTHGAQLRVNIVPGARLDLHRRKPVFLGPAGLFRPILRRHALRPPRYGTGVAVLRPHQPVAGHAQRLPRCIPQRHLQPGA